MLKQHRTICISHLLVFLALLGLITSQAGNDPTAYINTYDPTVTGFIQTPMDVFISNTPNFYYGKACQTTFDIISGHFSQLPSSGKNYISIEISNSVNGVQFLEKANPYAVVHFNNSKVRKLQSIPNCGAQYTNTKFCIGAPSSNDPLQDSRIQYNQTHFMHRFTFVHTKCPIKLSSVVNFHAVFQVSIVTDASGSYPKSRGRYEYSWKNLRHNMIPRILTNPNINKYYELQYTIDNNQPTQARNFYVGCMHKLSFVFQLRNITQKNNWEKLSIYFLTNPTQIQFMSTTCRMSINQGIKYSNQYGQSDYRNVGVSCLVPNANSNVLIFKNLNYLPNTYIQNSAFNVYGLYNAPGMRVNITIDIRFKSPATYKYYYQVTATTNKRISDAGQLGFVPISSNGISMIFQNSAYPQTITGMKQTQFDKAVQYTRAYCPTYTPPASYKTQTQKNEANLNNKIDKPYYIIPSSDLSDNSTFSIMIHFIGFVVVSIVFAGAIMFYMKKPRFILFSKFTLCIFLFLQFVFKVGIFLYIKRQNQKSQGIITILINGFFILFFILQFLICSIIFIAVYCKRKGLIKSQEKSSAYQSQSRSKSGYQSRNQSRSQSQPRSRSRSGSKSQSKSGLKSKSQSPSQFQSYSQFQSQIPSQYTSQFQSQSQSKTQTQTQSQYPSQYPSQYTSQFQSQTQSASQYPSQFQSQSQFESSGKSQFQTKLSSRTQNINNKKQQNKIFFYVSIICTYKLYCITFQGFRKNKIIDKLNLKRYYNKNVNGAYRFLTILQIIIIFVLSFDFCKICLNLYLIYAFWIIQILLISLLAALFKYTKICDKIENKRTKYTTHHGTSYGRSKAYGAGTSYGGSKSYNSRSRGGGTSYQTNTQGGSKNYGGSRTYCGNQSKNGTINHGGETNIEKSQNNQSKYNKYQTKCDGNGQIKSAYPALNMTVAEGQGISLFNTQNQNQTRNIQTVNQGGVSVNDYYKSKNSRMPGLNSDISNYNLDKKKESRKQNRHQDKSGISQRNIEKIEIKSKSKEKNLGLKSEINDKSQIMHTQHKDRSRNRHRDNSQNQSKNKQKSEYNQKDIKISQNYISNNGNNFLGRTQSLGKTNREKSRASQRQRYQTQRGEKFQNTMNDFRNQGSSKQNLASKLTAKSKKTYLQSQTSSRRLKQ